jgi:hypothetical protein
VDWKIGDSLKLFAREFVTAAKKRDDAKRERAALSSLLANAQTESNCVTTCDKSRSARVAYTDRSQLLNCGFCDAANGRVQMRQMLMSHGKLWFCGLVKRLRDGATGLREHDCECHRLIARLVLHDLRRRNVEPVRGCRAHLVVGCPRGWLLSGVPVLPPARSAGVEWAFLSNTMSGRFRKAREIAECCVCSRWEHGDWLDSGDRNVRTGETPCDNFICDRCQQEARDLREVGAACDRQERRRAAA